MVLRLDTRDAGFAQAFADLIEGNRNTEEDVSRVVRDIIAEVRARGDAALIAFSERFDKVKLTATTFRVADTEISAAEQATEPKLRAALETAAERIEIYHRKQLPEDARFSDSTGAVLGWRWRPLESVGLYVPGGTASYPSSVLMNAVPARVAGVKRIVMVTPASGGEDQSLDACRGAHRGRRGNLSDWRSAGRCRARLWHRDYKAG
jgi:histidinol dehydrogenase